MAWATAAEVLALTGTTVTDAQVAAAQGVIEVMAGVTEDAEDLTVRNLRLLRYAVSYQAVWQAAQVDVLTRTDVKAVNQDGVQVTPAGANALIVAPLAARCLSQLSWRRPGTVRVNRCEDLPRYASTTEAEAAFLSDDLGGMWHPL